MDTTSGTLSALLNSQRSSPLSSMTTSLGLLIAILGVSATNVLRSLKKFMYSASFLPFVLLFRRNLCLSSSPAVGRSAGSFCRQSERKSLNVLLMFSGRGTGSSLFIRNSALNGSTPSYSVSWPVAISIAVIPAAQMSAAGFDRTPSAPSPPCCGSSSSLSIAMASGGSQKGTSITPEGMLPRRCSLRPSERNAEMRPTLTTPFVKLNRTLLALTSPWTIFLSCNWCSTARTTCMASAVAHSLRCAVPCDALTRSAAEQSMSSETTQRMEVLGTT
mmetsp:Transcript_7256/g.18595  ORF Transcript_7256/g.18595 Transcript_7256/m.18595 type:complete len:275 (-) Transcript_7256:343-1167(-)